MALQADGALAWHSIHSTERLGEWSATPHTNKQQKHYPSLPLPYLEGLSLLAEVVIGFILQDRILLLLQSPPPPFRVLLLQLSKRRKLSILPSLLTCLQLLQLLPLLGLLLLPSL